MFSLAIILGIYSYLILLIGISGFLYKEVILCITLIPLLIICLLNINKIIKKTKGFLIEIAHSSKAEWFFLTLIVLQALVNFIGTLGPEISFDALWYHLTLPKIYLINHSINFIPGGLLYYSAMPKLIDMFYVFGLSLGSEILPKLIHYLFGILSLVAIYKLSRVFLSKKYSLVAALIFYTNLVVGWESITAYIDLGRVFFEIMALWGFINWVKTKQDKWLYESSVILGLAIATKLIAMSSLLIFLVLIIIVSLFNHKKWTEIISKLVIFVVFSLSIVLPWLIFSLVNTGNPVYPYFTNIAKLQSLPLYNVINLDNLLGSFRNLFITPSDPISPIYLICLPLVLLIFKKKEFIVKLLLIYTLLGLLFCYFIEFIGSFAPVVKGGTRFALPYLAVFSILCAKAISEFKIKKIKYYLMAIVTLTVLFSIFYRGFANVKYASVIVGIETKEQFLSKNLNFKFGDFYDTDGFFKRYIKPKDKVLLYGFHNLYYVDFPFIDSSWVKPGDSFNYIATQNTVLPKRFKNWSLIYENSLTSVKLYNHYGIKWHY